MLVRPAGEAERSLGGNGAPDLLQTFVFERRFAMRTAVFVAFLLMLGSARARCHGGCWGYLAEHADECGLDVLQRAGCSAHRVQRPGRRSAGDTGASRSPCVLQLQDLLARREVRRDSASDSRRPRREPSPAHRQAGCTSTSRPPATTGASTSRCRWTLRSSSRHSFRGSEGRAAFARLFMWLRSLECASATASGCTPGTPASIMRRGLQAAGDHRGLHRISFSQHPGTPDPRNQTFPHGCAASDDAPNGIRTRAATLKGW